MSELKSARRIDELGRVVIPKEIRKALRLVKGDLMEVFIEGERVCVKKYSPIKSLNTFASEFSSSLYQTTQKNVIVTDLERVVFTNKKLKEFINLPLSNDFLQLLYDKKSYLCNCSDGGKFIPICQGLEEGYNQFIVPLSSNGSLIGALVILSLAEEGVIDNAQMTAALFGARFLEKRFEIDEN